MPSLFWNMPLGSLIQPVDPVMWNLGFKTAACSLDTPRTTSCKGTHDGSGGHWLPHHACYAQRWAPIIWFCSECCLRKTRKVATGGSTFFWLSSMS